MVVTLWPWLALCVSFAVLSVRLLPAASVTSWVAAICAACAVRSWPAAMVTVSPDSVLPTTVLALLEDVLVVCLPWYSRSRPPPMTMPECLTSLDCCWLCVVCAVLRLTSWPAARLIAPLALGP